MPKNVKDAVQYLYLATVFAVVSLSTTIKLDAENAKISIASLVAINLISLGAQIFFIKKIVDGKSWARVLILFLFGFSIIGKLFGNSTGQVSSISTIFDLAIFVLFAVATWLLFTKSANEYFNSGNVDVDKPTPETHVRCPDCKELVRNDASVCKHCKCKLIPLVK